MNKKAEEMIRPWFSRGAHDWADVRCLRGRDARWRARPALHPDHYNYNFAQSGSDWADHYVFAGEAHLAGGKLKHQTFALQQHIHLSEHESERYERRKILDTVRDEMRAKLRAAAPSKPASKWLE